jgi:phage major head subunit gpT-like protein
MEHHGGEIIASIKEKEDKQMWSDFIKALEKEWIGKKVMWDGKAYNIVKVDYNGVLHIDKASKFNDTMAVYMPFEARKHLVVEA